MLWPTSKSILTLEQIEEQKAVHLFHFDDTTQIDCCKLDHWTANKNIEFILTQLEVCKEEYWPRSWVWTQCVEVCIHRWGQHSPYGLMKFTWHVFTWQRNKVVRRVTLRSQIFSTLVAPYWGYDPSRPAIIHVPTNLQCNPTLQPSANMTTLLFWPKQKLSHILMYRPPSARFLLPVLDQINGFQLYYKFNPWEFCLPTSWAYRCGKFWIIPFTRFLSFFKCWMFDADSDLQKD